jgi:hypothetical protein
LMLFCVFWKCVLFWMILSPKQFSGVN